MSERKECDQRKKKVAHQPLLAMVARRLSVTTPVTSLPVRIMAPVLPIVHARALIIHASPGWATKVCIVERFGVISHPALDARALVMALSRWTSLMREWIVVVALPAVTQVPRLSISAVLAVCVVWLNDVVPVSLHVVSLAVIDVRPGARGVAAAEVVCRSVCVVALTSVRRRVRRAGVVAEASIARRASLRPEVFGCS